MLNDVCVFCFSNYIVVFMNEYLLQCYLSTVGHSPTNDEAGLNDRARSPIVGSMALFLIVDFTLTSYPRLAWH